MRWREGREGERREGRRERELIKVENCHNYHVQWVTTKGRPRIVYYVFRDKMHRVLTVLQKLPSPCRAGRQRGERKGGMEGGRDEGREKKKREGE